MRSRVVYIQYGADVGGSLITLASIIRDLDKGKYEPIVVMPAGGAASLVKEAGAAVIEVHRLPVFHHVSGTYSRFWSLQPLVKARLKVPKLASKRWLRLLKRLEPEIVHVCSLVLAPILWCARASGASVVLSIQETISSGLFGVRKRWIEKQIQKNVDCVHYISEYDRRALSGCRTEMAEVIPNWVDLSEFDRRLSKENARRILGIDGNRVVVLTLGGDNPIKGTIHLLQAAALLKGDERLLFLVAGMDSPPQEHLKEARLKRVVKMLFGFDTRERIWALYRRENLAHCVRFLGVRRDIPILLAACDMLAFPATEGHQARPVLEAGAMAKPVIVSDFPCNREFVSQGQTGILVQPKDPADLCRAIQMLIQSPELGVGLGEGNYQLSVQRHNRATSAGRFSRIYDRLLERGHDVVCSA